MRAQEFVAEKWSTRYRRSIDCKNPRGFSQRANCAGRAKKEDQELKELNFKGSPCTKDCSGHVAGYEWSQRNSNRVPNSWSPSFNKGAALAAAGK
jgi:hypothetical protein